MTTQAKSPPPPLLQRGAQPSPAALEAVFRHIAATRMAGVSLLNPALEVEAVGFRPWREDWVGVLITPWFMSLICLPGPDSAYEPLSSGSKQDVALPSGDYEFLSAHEDALGHYLTSSLFSPMFEFPDMARAREVAEAVLAEVFKPADVVPPVIPPAPPVGLTEKLEQPMSRRGFFGALLRPGNPDA
ncbi:MAG: [NiFe]-hydrogenase assembly chaperone HybE [Pseudomonadota bacterium]|nr:[NiFe]-hydrogenase assembly chaperone HybE [Pseudomonadota bacterium]MDP2352892.1 [NiFe]-hydrogenase assembly chaperone HybE [Pseudomonadota bacterium]